MKLGCSHDWDKYMGPQNTGGGEFAQKYICLRCRKIKLNSNYRPHLFKRTLGIMHYKEHKDNDTYQTKFFSTRDAVNKLERFFKGKHTQYILQFKEW